MGCDIDRFLDRGNVRYPPINGYSLGQEQRENHGKLGPTIDEEIA